ncbi:MAG: hypothetical protein BLITH_0081 [Brockia lithotrophica]|uniref:Uncharacterized protein n=1 Tax=Brockia lithotrophica TaxID=933949 RepID=A0A2T5G524_9BACL|nr:MAG: hypothetical protein BLITH_0081 [Brockia lithotrophica]
MRTALGESRKPRRPQGRPGVREGGRRFGRPFVRTEAEGFLRG